GVRTGALPAPGATVAATGLGARWIGRTRCDERVARRRPWVGDDALDLAMMSGDDSPGRSVSGTRIVGRCVARLTPVVRAIAARVAGDAVALGGPRSEERRVGKECRSRWATGFEYTEGQSQSCI